jgi:hypothetical protein
MNLVSATRWADYAGAWRVLYVAELGPDSYFVPAMRYAMSFAGDPTSRRISEPQIAPTLNLDLPGRLVYYFLTKLRYSN